MTAHASGTGSSWDEAGPDIDRTLGQTYLDLIDIRKGVRKRLGHQHTTFADNTVGALHKRGGCSVLGMDITDDCTAGVAADGTYQGGGLVWSLSDTSNYGVLFCATGDGTAPSLDWTVLRMHPDLQWGSGDVTWAGHHEFDGSVDMTGPVEIDASVDVSTALYIDGSCEVLEKFHCFSDVEIEGDCTIDGTMIVDGCISAGAAADFDGTVNFNSTVDFSSDVTVSINGQATYKTVDFSKQMITAWANCGSATGDIHASNGVSVFTRTATGDYSVQWTSAFTDATSYVVSAQTFYTGAANFRLGIVYSQLTGSIGIRTHDQAGNAADISALMIMAIGT